MIKFNQKKPYQKPAFKVEKLYARLSRRGFIIPDESLLLAADTYVDEGY